MNAPMNPAGKDKSSFKRKLKIALGVLVLLVGAGGLFTWYKFFREVPQPAWITDDPDMRFKYGSIGAENDAGIPYWIFYVLPRMFPDKLPGPGGLASFGLSWEQGQELPIGFTVKTIGFPRVANNCATCHIANFRKTENETPTFITAGPDHTFNLEAMFRFLVDCAKDPRFNPDNMMREIDLVTDLSWVDGMIYRYLLIPITKKRLLEREQQFAWIYRKDFPEWGRGRDDAMNLTKYFMVKIPMDNSIGPTDIPAVWNLKKYEHEGTTLNVAGDSHDVYSVIIDSALGLINAKPKSNEAFLEQVKWLQNYLSNKPPPPFPYSIDATLAARGKALFDTHCASCHASEKTGKRMALAEVNTDRERIDTWSKENAAVANNVVQGFGIERRGLVEENLIGYNPPFLDGIWLRAPYLHNGAVPTLRDLLKPATDRPRVFWRGYDVYDPVNVGFVTSGEPAERIGTRHDTAERSNSNQGHEFGTALLPMDKEALLEYLKTL